jgi:hypothetical protein
MADETVEVAVIWAGSTSDAVPLGQSPLQFGRAPTNDIVIVDPAISWHHAQVWMEGGRVWIRDLASRNGTFVNEKQLTRPTALEPDDAVRLGAEVQVVIRGGAGSEDLPHQLLVEDRSTNVRFPLRSDRFRIGSGRDADLRIEGAPERAATLLVMTKADGGIELWLGGEEGEQEAVAIGEPFEVCGRSLAIVQGDAGPAPTVEYSAHAYPYRAVVTADGPTGPQARLEDPRSGRQILLTGNRGILLFLLARRLSEDRAAGSPSSEEGWANDNDITVGIWGRTSRDANNLHVLVYRLRKHLKTKGFDPWFIEKRHWGLRVRLSNVDVTDS